MIEDDKLYKIGDILNSEGMILGLFKNKLGNLFLGSYLNDGSGDLYYSTNLDIFKRYLNSEINLTQVYIESEDFIVTRKFRKEYTSFIKDDMINLISLADKFYSEIPSSMKNNQIEEKYIDN